MVCAFQGFAAVADAGMVDEDTMDGGWIADERDCWRGGGRWRMPELWKWCVTICDMRDTLEFSEAFGMAFDWEGKG